MSNEWDEYADNWDIDPTVKEYSTNAFESLLAKINIDGLCVLDFGCGTGALTQLLSPKVSSVVAIDPSFAMISHLDKKELVNVSSIADFLSDDMVKSHSEFDSKFDLIVASSECGFLPNYEETLGVLKSLLKTKGTFVQWDWLCEDGASGPGLSENRVRNAFQTHQFKDTLITSPFTMKSSQGSMPVLMAIGKST